VAVQQVDIGSGDHSRTSVAASPVAMSPERRVATGDPVGLFHAWWRGDPLPTLLPLVGLSIAQTDDVGLIADLIRIDPSPLRLRREAGHRPWLARLAGEPIGCGWVATGEAGIGELGLRFALPPDDRYLWDFFTLPAWRCRGVYTRLLRAIIASELADRFWVGHDLGNVASERGIVRAGFRAVGAVHRSVGGELCLVPNGPEDRAAVASALFGVPLAQFRRSE
jgi:hypothetical protein